MRNYSTILNGQRRAFRLRPFEELWDVKMSNVGNQQATIDVVARESPDATPHVLLCTMLAAGGSRSLEPAVWSRIVDHQTKLHLLDFELLETNSIVHLELVLGD